MMKPDPAMIAVRRIWRRCKATGMSQQQVAERMGVTQSAFSKFLAAGDARIGTLRRFARAVGVSIEEIVEIKEKF